MKKHQKQILTVAIILIFTATVLLLTGLGEAGKSEKPDPVMEKLQEIQDTLDYEVIPYAHKCCVGYQKQDRL
jgi:hypothetical protein